MRVFSVGIRNKYQLFCNLDFLRAAILDVVTFYGCHYYLYHPLGKPVNERTIRSCSVIVRVRVVLKRTVVGDSD